MNDGAWTLTFWKAHGLRRQPKTRVKCLDLELNCLRLNTSFVTYKLRDLKQDIEPLCALLFLSLKWCNSTTYGIVIKI